MKGCGLFLFGRLSHVCGFQQGSIVGTPRYRPLQISGFQRFDAAEELGFPFAIDSRACRAYLTSTNWMSFHASR
jgi:hypothetical protein